MDNDITALIGVSNRQVGEQVVDGKTVPVVTASRAYTTDIEDLWDALTNAERIPRWFLPITGDLRPGGHYQFEGNAGGDILRCEPPEHLGVTWGMQGGDTSWVNVRLERIDDESTRLSLEHVAAVPAEMWAQYGPGAVGVGWDLAMFGLGNYLVSGEGIPPEAAAAWQRSEEAKAMMRASSEAWGAALVASGESTETAAVRVAATSAFYTGEA